MDREEQSVVRTAGNPCGKQVAVWFRENAIRILPGGIPYGFLNLINQTLEEGASQLFEQF
jgi:hypothetical protein